MQRVDKGFSAAEDVRLFGRDGLTLEVYDKAGRKIHPPADANAATFSYISGQELWRFAAGVLSVGKYSYAVFETDNDDVRRIVRHGNLAIHAGAVRQTPDEMELEQIEAVLNGDDADVSAVKFPDGRETIFANREAMRIHANRLRERIAVHKRGSLMGISGSV